MIDLRLFCLQQAHLLLISLLHLIAWVYCLTLKGWCSDDIEGIAKFSDRFIQHKDPQGRVTKEEEIRSYEIEINGKKEQIRNTAWNATIGFPGCFLRWARINLGKSFRKIGTNLKGHAVYGWVQDARKHHALNLLFQWFNLLLGYNLISHLFGPQIAFFSMLLFAVHPCGTQTVGWVSGVNYIFSLFGALLTFNLALYLTDPHIYVPALILSSGFSCLTLLPGCLNAVILLLMGYKGPAAVAGVIGLIILARTGKETVRYRVAAFKEQHMEKSTGLYWRKAIIMVKTFWYYVRLILFPKRLGLFHVWGYHFEEPIEYADKEFWFGLLSLIGYGFLTWFAPPPVRFGLIWAFLYLLFFCNFITAQQFVSERYAYISTFGVSIAAAYALQNQPTVIAFIIGVALMRIWVHLPTFQNDVKYYESNCFNFPDSEVAMGNLGVAYLNHGMPNHAVDTWMVASRQNPLYDVPWYNLYSMCKQNGDVLGAKKFLAMCLNAKTVHFPDQWQKEMQELDKIIAQAISDGRIQAVQQNPQ